MAGCGTGFAKIMLIVFNIIFWLSGAALLGIGIWVLLDKNFTSYFDIFAVLGSGELLRYAAYVLIAVGGFVLIVGFFGCCGAIKENRCMLGVYIVLLVIIMGLEITAGVLAIVYKGELEREVTEKLEKTFKENYDGTDDKQKAFTQGVHVAQVQLQCCGMKDSTDYTVADDEGRTFPIPLSCCILSDEGRKMAEKDPTGFNSSAAVNPADCIAGTLTALNDKGCVQSLVDWAKEKSVILIGVGIGIACLELFGFIFAVCLCRSIGDDE